MKLSEEKRKNWASTAANRLYKEKESDLYSKINKFGNKYLQSFAKGNEKAIEKLGQNWITKSEKDEEITICTNANYSERLNFVTDKIYPFPIFTRGRFDNDTLKIEKTHPMFDEFISLVKESDRIKEEKSNDKTRILGVLRGCSTLNQVKKNFPDLVDFVPEISESVKQETALVIIPADLVEKIKNANAGK